MWRKDNHKECHSIAISLHVQKPCRLTCLHDVDKDDDDNGAENIGGGLQLW